MEITVSETGHKIACLSGDDAPWLIFGGAYSNLHALRALEAIAQAKAIPAQRIVCTGDVVAYCANPMESIDFVRQWGITVLAGNCEKQLASSASDCGCGFEDGTVCDRLSAAWFGFADREVTQEARDWMAALPDFVRFNHAGKRYFALHGGVSDISAFIWKTTDETEISKEMKAVDRLVAGKDQPDAILAGHSGIAFQRKVGAQSWINAGVIGMPPNNGSTKTEYLILDETRPRFCELSYDWQGAQAAMLQSGLNQGYHTALETGHWPSEDVLPMELRRASKLGHP